MAVHGHTHTQVFTINALIGVGGNGEKVQDYNPYVITSCVVITLIGSCLT